MNENTSKTEQDADWLDFKAIKINTQVRPVLEYFGILPYLKVRGAELVGWCPLGKEHGKEDSFAFNVEKKSFQCFACKARGSVLDFVVKFQGTNLREAAKLIVEITGEQGGEPQEKTARPYGKSGPVVSEEVKNEVLLMESVSCGKSEESFCFSWAQAEALVQAQALDPSRLMVIDRNALEVFMENLAETQTENPNTKKLGLLNSVDILIEKTELFRQLSLNEKGEEYLGVCPFCEKSGFSFHRLKEMYHCQNCKRTGGVMPFIIQNPKINISNPIDAWFWLEGLMKEAYNKGRPVDMTGWIYKED